MTTLVDFRAHFVQPIIDSIQNQSTEVLSAAEVIPLCGLIYYRGSDGEDAISSDYQFYLAAENGETARYTKDEGRYTIHDDIFDENEARQRVAALLGIAPEKIGLADEDEDYEHEDRKGFDLTLRWKFLYITISEFEQLRKTKKVKVSVVAERGYATPSQRWVAPNAVRVRDATFDFEVETAKLRFVARHNNSIEYLTEDGIKVFDNRRKVVGYSGGGIYGKGDQPEPIIAREDCLKAFLYDIWRGHKAKRAVSEEAERLRDYAGWALERVASYASIIANKEGRLIAEGIELLYGQPFVPAMELLRGRSSISDGFQWSKRELLHDADNSETWDDQDKKLDARYVVITDLPPKKK
jgi:hypothetical protein